MYNIVMSKQQSKDIAKAIIGDVKNYCSNNVDRFIPWALDDIRKEKGKPPLKPTVTLNYESPICLLPFLPSL